MHRISDLLNSLKEEIFRAAPVLSVAELCSLEERMQEISNQVSREFLIRFKQRKFNETQKQS